MRRDPPAPIPADLPPDVQERIRQSRAEGDAVKADYERKQAEIDAAMARLAAIAAVARQYEVPAHGSPATRVARPVHR